MAAPQKYVEVALEKVESRFLDLEMPDLQMETPAAMEVHELRLFLAVDVDTSPVVLSDESCDSDGSDDRREHDASNA